MGYKNKNTREKSVNKGGGNFTEQHEAKVEELSKVKQFTATLVDRFLNPLLSHVQFNALVSTAWY